MSITTQAALSAGQIKTCTECPLSPDHVYSWTKGVLAIECFDDPLPVHNPIFHNADTYSVSLLPQDPPLQDFNLLNNNHFEVYLSIPMYYCYLV